MSSKLKRNTTLISSMKLKHLVFDYGIDEYIVTLVDAEGFKIVSGYGESIVDAINDLHHNLI